MIKRLLSFILSAAMLMTLAVCVPFKGCAATSGGTPTCGIRGDADGDGSISIVDVTVIRRWLADYSVKKLYYEYACVINDYLSIIDATAIQRYLADYPDPHHIGEPLSGGEIPTDPPTDRPTVQPTESLTEPLTEPPTDPSAEPQTDPPAELPTESYTDLPTGPPAETPTDSPTEPPTEPPTEQPTAEICNHIPVKSNAYTINTVCSECGCILDDYADSDIYGISFDPSTAAEDDQRICAAASMQNAYMTGDVFAGQSQNDFDSVYPWAGMRRCCIRDDQVIYEGEPGFDLYGGAGDVFVEIPAFRSCRETVDGKERIAVSPTAHEGFSLEPAFYDPDGNPLSHIYVAAYATSAGSASVSGAAPTVNTRITENMTAAEEKGFTVYDAAVWAALQKLIIIEFGTMDLSGYLNGIGELPYNQECAATRTEKSAHRIRVATTGTNRAYRAKNLAVGMNVAVSDTPDTSGDRRRITKITEGKTYRTFEFDGPAVNVTEGKTFISGVGQDSGQTDSIPYHTGRGENNVASSFKYRGIENLWGNVWMQTAGLVVKNLEYYYTADPSLYRAPISEWYKLSFAAPEQNQYPTLAKEGWIKSFGTDVGNSHLFLPDALTFDKQIIGDKMYSYLETAAGGTSIAPGTEFMCLTGGGWDHVDFSGPFTVRFWSARNTGISWLYGSRLVIRRSL